MIRVELRYEDIRRASARQRAAAKIECTGEASRHDCIPERIERHTGPILIVRVAERAAPSVLASDVDFGQEHVRTACAEQRFSAEVDEVGVLARKQDAAFVDAEPSG